MTKNLLLFILSTTQLFSAEQVAPSETAEEKKAGRAALEASISRLEGAEPGGVSSAAAASTPAAPNLLTPLQINLESFISLTPPKGFEVHGADGLHRLYKGTPGDHIKLILQLQPYMPKKYPVLLTSTNKGLFKPIEDKHDGKTVMLMAVFFSEFLGKRIDPVIIYFTRPHVQGETVLSDDMFRDSYLGKTTFSTILDGYRSTIAQTLGHPVSLNFSINTLLNQLKLWADVGIAAAQSNLAFMYYHGLGVAQDYPKALRYYRLSADQGNAYAQCDLASMYFAGLGVAQDYGEVLRYTRLSADQRNAYAQSNLGYMYEHGLGVAQDYAEALRLFGLSAAQGNAYAQCELAFLKVAGLGCEQSLSEAFNLYNQLALKPDAKPLDKFNYGVFLYLGIETSIDKEKGLYLMKSALDLNHPRVFYLFHKLHQHKLIDGANDADADMYLSTARAFNISQVQMAWVKTILEKGHEHMSRRHS